jgi:uncharacterized protein YgiM (DUF1202 family)
MRNRFLNSSMSVAFAAALCLGLAEARAQDGADVDITNLKSELSKVHAAAKPEEDGAPQAAPVAASPSGDGFSMKDDADLEHARTLLLQKESQLLDSLKKDEPAAEAALSNDAPPAAVKAAVPVSRPSSDAEVAAAKQLQNKISNQTSEISTLKRTNSSLEDQLAKAKARNTELLTELENVRNRLFVAETEVERLNSTLQARNASTLNRLAPGVLQPSSPTTTIHPAPVAPVQSAPAAAKARMAEPPRAAQAAAPAGDMPTALVVADKANLRTAPNKDSAPFMTVSKGTRLVVESQRDGWYSVYAPNGSRAWVSGEVLQFGSGDLAAGRTTIRPKAYDPSL